MDGVDSANPRPPKQASISLKTKEEAGNDQQRHVPFCAPAFKFVRGPSGTAMISQYFAWRPRMEVKAKVEVEAKPQM